MAAHRCAPVELGSKLAADKAKVRQLDRVAEGQAVESRALFMLVEDVVDVVAQLAR